MLAKSKIDQSINKSEKDRINARRQIYQTNRFIIQTYLYFFLLKMQLFVLFVLNTQIVFGTKKHLNITIG